MVFVLFIDEVLEEQDKIKIAMNKSNVFFIG